METACRVFVYDKYFWSVSNARGNAVPMAHSIKPKTVEKKLAGRSFGANLYLLIKKYSVIWSAVSE